jgi:hypothetical protein
LGYTDSGQLQFSVVGAVTEITVSRVCRSPNESKTVEF